MENNLDTKLNLRGGDGLKWNIYKKDVIPMWVADMDWRSPEPMIDALRERVEHGVFGYPGQKAPRLKKTFIERMWRLYHWRIKPEEIVLRPGGVPCFNIAAHAFGKPGDDILVQNPAYPPMRMAPKWAGRKRTIAPMVPRNGRYEIDFKALEAAITDKTRLFIFCNPHNPTGRMFTKPELERMGNICAKHNVVILCDEIHSDLILDGKHVPLASISKKIAKQTITLYAPSKTFNVPGLTCCLAVIQDKKIRKQFEKSCPGIFPLVNIFGLVAAEAAYRAGDEWLADVRNYLRANREYMLKYIKKNMPGVKILKPQGTYLAWLDCRKLNLKDKPYKFFLKKAKVALVDGHHFGDGYEQFVRLNYSCPRSVLEEALGRMSKAIKLNKS